MPESNTPPAIPRTPARSGRRRSWRFKLAALCIGIAFAFFALEVFLRLAGIGFPNFFEPDPFCGSRLRKSTSGVWMSEGHGNTSINSLGFRGPEIQLEKDPSVRRICVLGDSFIEALQVNHSDTFCAKLQDLLNRKNNDASLTFEVINCGVSGYGTAQELLLLQNYVMPLQPDAIVLAIFPENDIRNNSRTLDGSETRPYFELKENGQLLLDASFQSNSSWLIADSAYERAKARIINRSRVLQLAQELRRPKDVTKVKQSDAPDILESTINEHWYAYRNPEHPDSPEAMAWNVTERLIHAIAAECADGNVPMFSFNVPTPIQIWPDPSIRDSLAARCKIEDWFYAEKRLHSICENENIPFFELASTMQREAESRNVFLEGFPNATVGIGHWNVEGNSLAADVISNWLWTKHFSRNAKQNSDGSADR